MISFAEVTVILSTVFLTLVTALMVVLIIFGGDGND